MLKRNSFRRNLVYELLLPNWKDFDIKKVLFNLNNNFAFQVKCLNITAFLKKKSADRNPDKVKTFSCSLLDGVSSVVIWA